MNDLAAYQQYCKDQIRKNLLSLENFDKRLIIQGIAESERQGMDIDKTLGSIEGIRFLFWRALLPHHTEITLEEVGAIISMDNMDEMTSLMMDSEDKPEDKKKQTESPSSGTS